MGKRLRDGKKAAQQEEGRKRGRSPSPEEEDVSQEEEEVEVIEEVLDAPLPQMLRMKVDTETGDRRIVLEALHTLNARIEEIEEQQANEIQQIKMKYFKQMKPIIAQSADVIQGKAKGNELLKDKGLSEEQLKKGVDGLRLEDYWAKVFGGSQLTEAATADDKRILDSVVNFSMDLERNGKAEKIHLEFTFNNCPLVEQKSWKCTLEKDEEGVVKRFSDEPLKLSKKCQSDIFSSLNTGEGCYSLFEVFSDFFEEVYPRSLYYYYNLAEREDENLEFEDDDEDEEAPQDSDEPEEKPQKKRKLDQQHQKKKGGADSSAPKTEKPECKTQ